MVNSSLATVAPPPRTDGLLRRLAIYTIGIVVGVPTSLTQAAVADTAMQESTVARLRQSSTLPDVPHKVISIASQRI